MRSLLRMSPILLVAALATPGPGAVSLDSSCTVASPPDTSQFSSTNLGLNLPLKTGVTYDSTDGKLKLVKEGAVFKQSSINIGEPVFLACGADFDKDGWVDFVGAGPDSDAWARFYKNDTKANSDLVTTSQWYDTNFVVTPKFTGKKSGSTPVYIKTGSSMGGGSVGCGDVNKDGNPDFIYVRCTSGNNCTPSVHNVYLGNGDGTFQGGYDFAKNASDIQYMGWSGNSIEVFDWNGDSWPDLVYGINASTSATSDGKLLVLLSDKKSPPKFGQSAADILTLTSSPGLLPISGKSATGINAVTVRDFTGDGVVDVIVGGSSGANAPMYRGKVFGSGVIANLNGFTGGAQTMIPADYNLDGKIDLMIATDGKNGRAGEKVFYWKNNGTNTPFSDAPTVLVNGGLSNTGDLDLGFALDYDHDPDSTNDVLVSDGNDSGKFFILANRVVNKYVTCGTVESIKLDVGSLSTSEATVTELRLTPTQTVPTGTKITYWATNTADKLPSPTWVQAVDCGDGQVCASLSTVGRELKWKAEMCSDTLQSATPVVSAVKVEYSYVGAANHFRAGPVVHDGVIYVGATQLPGDNGHFYAVRDETGTRLWDAAPLLDSNSSRKILVAPVGGGDLIELNSTNAAQAPLQAALGVSTTSDANAIINWLKSARFGLINMHVLGGIETSTAAILGKPNQPEWYAFRQTTVADQTAIDAYIAATSERTQLALVGAKDGMLHAFYTNPGNVTDTRNGSEVWAFIPPGVATELAGDQSFGTVSAYADGSPTLADAVVNGSWKTVLVMGQGAGGKSVFALDVTDSAVNGPSFLWSFADPDMGATASKPAVIRVKVGDAERWLAVFASGPGTAGQGDSIYAVDLSSGTKVWQFSIGDTGAYISSDIAAYETDDEEGTVVDGYIDRVVFGDSKGRIWKLSPSEYTVGGGIASIGTVDVGLGPEALFATAANDALGAERGIAGTMAISDNTSDKHSILYFGTGGAGATGANNAVFGIDLASGEIRQRSDSSDGTKYAAGVASAHGQVIAVGARTSSSALCASSSGTIAALNNSSFDVDSSLATTDKLMGPMYIQDGRVFMITEGGSLLTSQYAAPSSGGGDTSGNGNGNGNGGNGGGNGNGNGQGVSSGADIPGSIEDAFQIVSWRQVN